jgi:hypothetical protein
MTGAHFRQRLRDASRPPVRLPSAVAFGSLEDGMKVCLGLLRRDPDRFEPAAVAWHARWSASSPAASFEESRAVLSSLEALRGPDPAGAAGELSAACQQCRQDELASVFDAWLERRSDIDQAAARHRQRVGPNAA